MILAFSNYQPIATFYFNNYAFFIVQTLILVLVLQCNFSENDLIGKFARIGNVAKITRYTLHYTATLVLHMYLRLVDCF